MEAETSPPVSGNAIDASKDTRGWFLGHFMPGTDNPLRTEDVELKWYTHAKGQTRDQWAPANEVRTLNVLIRGKFVLLFPDREVPLEREGDFVPSVPASHTRIAPSRSHSF